jgi:hypothetical protein
MAGPLAALVDLLLRHAPQFNAKSLITVVDVDHYADAFYVELGQCWRVPARRR